MSKQQVVILGRNYVSLLGMIRSVGVDNNYDVILVKSVKQIQQKNNLKSIIKKIVFNKAIDEASKYVKKCLYTIEPDREMLINLLLEEFRESEDKVILIPTDDFTASTIDLYQDKLSEKFLFPNILNQKGEVVKIMNKGIQKQLATQSGLNVAKGYIINYSEEKYEIPDGIIYPVFTKPQVSFKGDKTLMKKCNTEEELKKLLNYATQEYKCPILIEQYIEIEKEYGILGCSYNNDVILPGIIKKLESGNGEHKGVTLFGETISFEGNEELYEGIKKFIKELKFNGLFDIDVYESNKVLYFNELNLRFGAAGYAITKAGVNLPQIFIKKLLGKDNIQLNQISNKFFVSEKVNLEDFETGYKSWKEYNKTNSKANFGFIKDEDDIKPYIIFKKKEMYAYLKKALQKLVGGSKHNGRNYNQRET